MSRLLIAGTIITLIGLALLWTAYLAIGLLVASGGFIIATIGQEQGR